MNIFETTILGIIQGLTEFLPVSSSGHLVLFQNLLGFKEPELLLDCSLHFGTLLAVCVYFRNDLKKIVTEIWKGDFKNPHASLALWIVVGSVPTAVIGLVFKAPLERLFGSVTIVGATLIVTGIIVALTRMIPEGFGTRTRVGLLAALAVGTAQGLAIIPGISRSGTTIVCALLLGLDRDLAGRFSFLLAIPAIIGALAIQIDLDALERVGLVPLGFGFFSSAIVGLLALKLLMGIVRKGHLYYFAPYCWVIGLVVVFASL
jgi:undecaprenyl-diphosphatase